MAEARDIRLRANATDEDIQAMRNTLHEHTVTAEIQARTIAELDARNLGLPQENVNHQRQIAELSDGEAFVITDALVTKAVFI